MKYVENVNKYIDSMKIKQTYISLKTGIDKNKLSRILSGSQVISGIDMDKISKALGKNIEYFLQENFVIPTIQTPIADKIAFYAGNPTSKQDDIAKKLESLMENIDEVMSAKGRFLNIKGE